jgi:hypothetical protein
MSRTSPRLTTAALIVCLLGTQLSGTALASEETTPTSPEIALAAQSSAQTPYVSAPSSSIPPSRLMLSDVAIASAVARIDSQEPLSFAQWGRSRGRGGRWGDNRASQAAIILGGIASITGAALLIYANRPDCSVDRSAQGCGYGTKVVGGAVLTGGLVGLVAGAVTWR